MAKKTSSANSAELSELGARTAGVASSVLLSSILTAIVAGVSFIIVSRYLGPSVYGAYALAVAVAGTLAAFGNMGISNSFSKFVSQYKASKQQDKVSEVLSSGYFLTLVVGGALTIVAILLAGTLSAVVFKNTADTLLIQVASLSILLSMLLSVSTYALIGFGHKKQIVGVTAVQISVQAVLSITLAFSHFGAFAPAIGVIFGFLAGTLLALGEIARIEKITLSMPKRSEIMELLRFSMPLGVYSAVTGMVSNAANLILGTFAGTTVVETLALPRGSAF
jgi:O-antigen/teichoic acid export membrane protein